MKGYLVYPGSMTPAAERLSEHLGKLVGEIVAISRIDDLPPARRISSERSIAFVVGRSGMPDLADAVVELATRRAGDLYCVYIADRIDAAAYKRLLRTGNAEWAQTDQAASELREIVSRWMMRSSEEAGPNAVIACFLPSGGGVGNTTLAIEASVIAARESGRRDVCLVDLNFQDGNVCDLLNLEPSLNIAEVSANPERLDDHMLDIFTVSHETGVDVFATPKDYADYARINPQAVYALFNALNQRYCHVIVDHPHLQLPWTENVIANANFVLLTGQYSVPSALRLAAARSRLQELGVADSRLAVIVNKYASSPLPGHLGKSRFEEALGVSAVHYVTRDDKFVSESADLGEPMVILNPRRRICRDIESLLAQIQLSGGRTAQGRKMHVPVISRWLK